MAMDRVSYDHVQCYTLKENTLFVASVPPGGRRERIWYILFELMLNRDDIPLFSYIFMCTIMSHYVTGVCTLPR